MSARRTFLAAAAAAAAALGSARVAGAQSALNLRVGATANDTYAQAYFALDGGFFTRAGLNVDLQTLNNGAAVSAAVASGALDVGVSTPVQLANARAHGVPFVLVAAGALETARVPVSLLCVAKNGTIRGAKDFEGKVVAVNALKTLSEAGLDLWLAQNGADVAKVRTVETVFSEMGAAVDRGAMAGAVISEPALSIAMHGGQLRSLGDPLAAIAPQFLISGWFATDQWVAKNPELVKRFRLAIDEAGRWANDHHDQSAAILAKYAKMNVDVIRAMGRCPFTDQLRVSDIQPQLDVGLKFGIISKATNAAELIAG